MSLHWTLAPLRKVALIVGAFGVLGSGSVPTAMGQQGNASIYYDSQMIPHIISNDSDQAAFYALGYHHMRDFPIATLNALWLYSGVMAEKVGEDYLDVDCLVNLWEVRAIADRHKAELGTEKLCLLQAYVDGIEDRRLNYWVAGTTTPPGSSIPYQNIDILLGNFPRPNSPFDFEVFVDPVPDYLNPGPYGSFKGNKNRIRQAVFRLFEAPVTVDNVLWLGVAANSFFLLQNNDVRRTVFLGPKLPLPLPPIVSLAPPELLLQVLKTPTIVPPPPPGVGGGTGVPPPGGGGVVSASNAGGLGRTDSPPESGIAASRGNGDGAETGLSGEKRSDERRLVSSVFSSNGWLISGTASGTGPVTLTDPHAPVGALHIRPYVVDIQGPTYRATGLSQPGCPAVILGYNERISWLFTAANQGPVLQNKWGATLDPNGTYPDDLSFVVGGGNVSLERVSQVLKFFDPTLPLPSLRSVAVDFFYVPADPTEDNRFCRYPVVPQLDSIRPTPGGTIQFEQGSFTVERSPWEFLIGMGQAQDADGAIAAILNIPGSPSCSQSPFPNGAWFSRAANFLVADRNDHFRYLYMARVPKQGTGVPCTLFSQAALLDGSRLDHRWRGYHLLTDLPRIDPKDVSGSSEVWMNNNVSPEKTSTRPLSSAPPQPLSPCLTPPAPPAFPLYMVPASTPTSPSSTWRQERAEALFGGSLMPPAGSIPRNSSEGIALDARDLWMEKMWPFFVDASDKQCVTGAVSQDAEDLRDWIDVRQPFDATPESEVQVYAVLLRSEYLLTLEAAKLDPNGCTGCAPDWNSFGYDPEHALVLSYTGSIPPSIPPEFTCSNYSANIEAMKDALEFVAAYWVAEMVGGPNPPFQNQAWLTQSTTCQPIPGEPFGPQSPQRPIRWGDVNVDVLTPHAFAPLGSSALAAFTKLNPCEFFQNYLYLALRPNLLTYPQVQIPFYQFPNSPGNEVRAWPIKGVETSLFNAVNRYVPVSGYIESLYDFCEPDPCNTETGPFFWSPRTTGSQTLLSVELNAASAPLGNVLQRVGGTEILEPLLLSVPQGRFAPTIDFINGQWKEIIRDEGVLNTMYGAQYTVSYTCPP